ncbi:hypothetical protein ACRALDRAFT_2017633 [Sodiomyces alcalophilus JCM 7366]|uniref:uncharacterized protein n=1 Tax=Sodiomyces alcalophilus JCM 7366 TaxID=591952 RepID=UPI0039B65FEE
MVLPGCNGTTLCCLDLHEPETCVPFVREQNKEYCLALRLMGTRLRDVAWSLKQVTASNAMMQEQAGDDDNGIPIKASPVIDPCYYEELAWSRVMFRILWSIHVLLCCI